MNLGWEVGFYLPRGRNALLTGGKRGEALSFGGRVGGRAKGVSLKKGDHPLTYTSVRGGGEALHVFKRRKGGEKKGIR